MQQFMSYRTHKLFGVSRNGEKSENTVVTLTFDLEILWVRAVVKERVIPRLHDKAGSTSWLVSTSARRAGSSRRALDEPARRASFIV